ncbi:MAG: Unknown protein [uncultured Sulfurovum sp.]|uniref:diguanylate cyclase n=1 Tax=uncultured Sulfurovum sp. TaxID=269237 RepID=A0A6S6U9N2_9BACT|nr:MAG: Unknown protein [uncultured Sulfurovum sp.]
MSNFTIYAVLLTAIIIFFSLRYHYKSRLNNVLQSFLNSHDNIMVLVHSQTITMINNAGLKVFGYDSLKSFKMSNADISGFFIDNEIDNKDYERDKSIEYINKYTHGKKWVEKVAKSKKTQVRVKIFSKEDMMDRFYQIRVSKLNSGNNYSLSFTDITELEANRLNTKRTAEFDPLTQIYNRIKVNELLKHLMYGSKKHNHDLTLILFDIDHFKRVNDDYGHNAGDSVLKELSGLVKDLLKETVFSGNKATFARWGGEEFVVLLEEISLEESVKIASYLRHEIEKFNFKIVENITCSFGVTKFRAGDTEIKFFERVDEALYEAKERGRNQVVTK